MKVELKKIMYAAFASEETNCFSADVYIDGVKSLNARNEGHGGCNFYHEYVNGSVERLEAYAKTLPDTTFHGTKLKMDADLVIGDLLEAWIFEKETKRLLRKTCFTKKGMKGIFNFKTPFTPELAKKIREKRPDIDKILNEIPFAEAVAIVKEAA